MEQLHRDRYRAEKYGYDCTTQNNVLRITTGAFVIGEVTYYGQTDKDEYVFINEKGYETLLTRHAFIQRLIRLAGG